MKIIPLVGITTGLVVLGSFWLFTILFFFQVCYDKCVHCWAVAFSNWRTEKAIEHAVITPTLHVDFFTKAIVSIDGGV